MNNQSYNKKEKGYSIKRIDAKETHQVRHPVLRGGKPIESCVFDGDNLDTTIHLGLFVKDKLIGVCSFLKNNHDLISETSQYQLRGMAILKAFQNYGFGKAILNYGELYLKNEGTNTIWCHARKIAVNFYKKNGYQIIGTPFNIKDIGLHYIMYKTL
ncbi:GNAT family N-acetyltransferase [Thalassobellus suaedae]|uniref:GNAT family N-acetyltransferase n=1 Tax=Thalassobellus suaedae TaxID=3074124 RepID=A0ABY9XQ07_9FLAO|nr:GNAT family N-acetyltransferase [Flavobacteriaceae bacterium HL-DH14]